MGKKRGKRAQFYIIAAIIIVLIVISLSSVVTYSIIRSQPKSITELSENLRTEQPFLFEHAYYTQTSIDSLLQNFTEESFAEYFGLSSDYEYTNLTFLYGNKTNLYLVNYTREDSGGVTVGGTQSPGKRVPKIKKEIIIETTSNTIEVFISGKKYNFDLSQGPVFYFVMTNEKNGEVYVQTNTNTPTQS